MKLVKRLIADLLSLLALSTLLLASCAVPMGAYFQSPRWFPEQVGPDVPSTFFVAVRSEDGENSQRTKVVRFDAEEIQSSNDQYHLPDGHLNYNWGTGSVDASIDVTTEAQGSQLVRVFVAGNSPWTSFSEYRVVDNKVIPLRHSDPVAWFLIGIPVFLFILSRFTKPIRRGIRGLLGVESK